MERIGFPSLAPPDMKLTTIISRHTRHYLRVLDSPKVLVISGVEDSEGIGGLVGGDLCKGISIAC